MATKVKATSTTSTEQSDEKLASKLSFKMSDWPKGAKVEYVGERVSERTEGNKVGTIIGYRPSNGLWVRFPNGTGSISIKTAKLLSKGAAKASSKKGKASTQTEPEPVEPAASA